MPRSQPWLGATRLVASWTHARQTRIIDRIFDERLDDELHSRAFKRADPHMPALVNLPQVLLRPDDVMIGRVPFWLRGGALNLSGEVPGMLLAQFRSSNGG